ncbi:hypothetical protein AABM38_20815 [Heyndrickxia sp. MSNUG]|uniref:hypothetical protein n=1 Tax=Heyndrickxia sp. MSNUG TaxID=3136677 RepID=UPI003C2D63CE
MEKVAIILYSVANLPNLVAIPSKFVVKTIKTVAIPSKFVVKTIKTVAISCKIVVINDENLQYSMRRKVQIVKIRK